MTQPAKSVPSRTENNLIVAAYNIQFLGDRTHDLDKLAEVIQHFDICGLIEVRKEAVIPRIVRSLEAKTHKAWGYVHGVRTHRPGGTYHEAYGFVWLRERVQLGDGLVSNIWDKTEKFRNDPFVASFKRDKFDFIMALIHTRWSDDIEGTRVDEIKSVAQQVNWMKTFIDEDDLLVAGDFNYSGAAPEMTEMAQEANLVQLDNNAKSTFKTNGSDFKSPYDHIYVGAQGKDTQGRLVGKCTTLDICHLVYGDNDPENMKRARTELSDHLPVFATFKVG